MLRVETDEFKRSAGVQEDTKAASGKFLPRWGRGDVVSARSRSHLNRGKELTESAGRIDAGDKRAPRQNAVIKPPIKVSAEEVVDREHRTEAGMVLSATCPVSRITRRQQRFKCMILADASSCSLSSPN